MTRPDSLHKDEDIAELQAALAMQRHKLECFDELVEALEGVLAFFEMPGEVSSERFDRLAMQYHRETGNIPPGKSWPPELENDEPTPVRIEKRDRWAESKVANARAVLARAQGRPK